MLYYIIYVPQHVFFLTYGKNGRWHYLPFILFYIFFAVHPTFLVLLLVWYICVCDLENDRKFRSRSHKKWFDLVLRSFKKNISNNSFRSQKNIRSLSDRKFIRSLMPWQNMYITVLAVHSFFCGWKGKKELVSSQLFVLHGWCTIALYLLKWCFNYWDSPGLCISERWCLLSLDLKYTSLTQAVCSKLWNSWQIRKIGRKNSESCIIMYL